MNFPEITDAQREMVVEMLANALRKDAHLRRRADREGTTGGPLHAGMVQRRAEPSRRYIEGMRDLLRVLFPDGHAVAEACLAEAHLRAFGASDDRARGENGAEDR